MTCNCDNNGSNEYIIELGEQGIPGQQGEKGDPGFSPTVTYTGDNTGIQFNIVNETETFTTPTVPLMSYVNTAFLKVDGSNANNPITLNGLTINKAGGSPIVTGDINLYLRGSQVAISANPSLNPTVGISVQPNTISLGDMNTKYLIADTDTVKYGRLGQQSEIATLADIPSVTNFLEVDGSNASNVFAVNGNSLTSEGITVNNGVKISGNSVSPNTSGNGTVMLKNYFSSTFQKDAYVEVSSNGNIYLGTTSPYKALYNYNEIATINQIPTVSDATITITQDGVTKGTFTLNGSATTIDLDAGGGAITNPLVVPSDSGNQSISLGFEPNSSVALFKETLTLPGIGDVDVPLHIIKGSTSPIDITKDTSTGLSTISLNYDNDTIKVNQSGQLYAEIPSSNDIEAHKAYKATGELLTDSKGLADVTEYAHSTFDSTKFTVVGSPNITNDGIASGFNSSNYMTASINKTYDIVNNTYNFRIKYKYDTNGNGVIARIGRFWVALDDTNIRLQGQDTNSAAKNFTNVTIPTPSVGDEYIITGSFGDSGNTRSLSVSVNGGTPINGTNTANTPNLSTQTSVNIWIGINNNITSLVAGSIDLKQFSITINGVEVFNGNKTGIDTYTIGGSTVTIPYTLSKTGSKIVDSTYRTQVANVYNTFGFAPYYTLLEGINFTLPQGELYGLIGQRTLRDTYRNGIFYYDLYSDRTLEQGGSCTSGTNVTFLKPFSDTNYVLTIPYSAKTTTGFTPSATGDWIAKGIGEL